MHYKNGRVAQAGDRIVQVMGGAAHGVLHSVNPGSDSCNGRVATITSADPYVNIHDCLHVDDVSAATIPDSTKPNPA